MTKLALRNTAAYVTDPVGVTYWLGEDSYPTTRDGITFGRLVGATNEGRNRSTAYDPRLAGCIQRINTNTQKHVLQIDLPDGPGLYLVNLAIGDMSFPQENHIKILDGTTQVFQIAISTLQGQFADVEGNLHTQNVSGWVPWEDVSSSVACEFNDKIIIEIGRGEAGVNNGSALSYISLSKIVPEYETEIVSYSDLSSTNIVIEASVPTYNTEIVDISSFTLDSLSAVASIPEYSAEIEESSSLSNVFISAETFKPKYLSEIEDTSFNSTTRIGVLSSPPIYEVSLLEKISTSFDLISAGFDAGRAGGSIIEHSALSTDSLVVEASKPVFTAAIVEYVPHTIDSITAGQIVYYDISIEESSSLSTDRVRISTRDCTPVSKGQIIVVGRVSNQISVLPANNIIEVRK